jgi:REP element-mobilizing transposase RayT
MKHNRRSIRLKEYDYSREGVYFITICAYKRQYLFGKISVGANGCSPNINLTPHMILNEYGKIVQYEWKESEKIRSEIQLDQFIVMPNHVHGIVMINNNDYAEGTKISGANSRSPLRRMKPKSIPSFIAGYKSVVTKRINQIRNTPRQPVWQRNYYEHVIRDEHDLNRIRKYIVHNPVNWEKDDYHDFQ